MANELDKLTVHNNILDRLTAIERSLRRYTRTDLRADDLSEISESLGEANAGADTEGEELADPTWAASTSSPSITVYTTDRMPANEFALMDFRVNMTPANRVFLPNESGLRSYLKIAWYDAMVGGSELSRDDLAFLGGVTFRRTLLVPVEAVACAFVCGISARTYGSMGVINNAVSGFSAREVSWAIRMSMEPVPSVQVEGVWQRLSSGSREFAEPGRPPTAAQVSNSIGNLSNGTYRYRITWVDEYGETTPGMADGMVVDATHKRVTVTAPLPIPAGITAWRIYRTLANGAETDPFYLVATLSKSYTSYEDNVSDANLGAAAPEANTTLGRPVLPTYHNFKLYEMAGNKTLSRQNSDTQVEGEYWNQASAANGDWRRTPGFLLEPGRYTVTVLGVTATNRGKLDWYLDGQIVEGGQEWYSGSTVLNVEKTINFVVEEPGWHELVFVVNGKHASSSGYYYGLTGVRLERTGR